MLYLASDFVRWILLFDALFLALVSAWSVVAITRMQQQQVVSTAMLEALAARAGLRSLIDVIQTHVPTERISDLETVLRRVDRLLRVWAIHWGEPSDDLRKKLIAAIAVDADPAHQLFDRRTS